jgi:hypothetical protein
MRVVLAATLILSSFLQALSDSLGEEYFSFHFVGGDDRALGGTSHGHDIHEEIHKMILDRTLGGKGKRKESSLKASSSKCSSKGKGKGKGSSGKKKKRALRQLKGKGKGGKKGLKASKSKSCKTKTPTSAPTLPFDCDTMGAVASACLGFPPDNSTLVACVRDCINPILSTLTSAPTSFCALFDSPFDFCIAFSSCSSDCLGGICDQLMVYAYMACNGCATDFAGAPSISVCG